MEQKEDVLPTADGDKKKEGIEGSTAGTVALITPEDGTPVDEDTVAGENFKKKDNKAISESEETTETPPEVQPITNSQGKTSLSEAKPNIEEHEGSLSISAEKQTETITKLAEEEKGEDIASPSDEDAEDSEVSKSEVVEKETVKADAIEEQGIEKADDTKAVEIGKETKTSRDEVPSDESGEEDTKEDVEEEKHHIPFLDYESMTMDALVAELSKLVRKEKVQAIREHAEGIKTVFNKKFKQFIDGKKEEFVAGGGNKIDFRYNSLVKRQFSDAYREYRELRNQYYKDLERSLKDNLQKRLEIIEELKGLISIEEDINTTYRNFKDIQERWRNAGPIPRLDYNNVWNTYQHHVERFYDFLHLNRDLRDLDFKHNLGEKEKLIQQAETLVEEKDVQKAFKELQRLHKLWKEEVGPVAREHRDEIWERFSKATKVINDRRQEHFKELEKTYEVNLGVKKKLVEQIRDIIGQPTGSHKMWQNKIRDVEALRKKFFDVGRVPLKVNEEIWTSFRDTVREFNRKKNAFYKELKREQHNNLTKKMELVKMAESLKDSDDWEETTPIMKKIQSDWKYIGHVPRKYSDKIWKDFKNACNHYFERLHAIRDEADKDGREAFTRKRAFLEELRQYVPDEKQEDAIEDIKAKIATWQSLGKLPQNKRHLEGKFYKVLDGIFEKLKISIKEGELIKYEIRLDSLQSDPYRFHKEVSFVKRKIEEESHEVNQLENNLQFFSQSSGDNPLVQEVVRNLQKHKDFLEIWKEKLRKLRAAEKNNSDQ